MHSSLSNDIVPTYTMMLYYIKNLKVHVFKHIENDVLKELVDLIHVIGLFKRI